VHKIVFVTGKGGVGKSAVAALVARKEASLGRKTLLVEMGPWSFQTRALGLKKEATYTPTATPFGFDLALWTGEDCLKEYVGHLIKLPWLSRVFFENAWMRALVKVAPGLREISFLGKVTSQIRDHGPALRYDSIIVDAVSSGHFLSLLQAPVGLKNMSKTGPIRDQCGAILEALNSAAVKTLVVTTLESFAIHETIELVEGLRNRLKSDIQVVMNKTQDIPEVPKTSMESNIVNELSRLKSVYTDNRQKILEVFPDAIDVPFYFSPLLQVLENETELQRIFSKI
jgi:anion-transporting  ArsA/GET3 family ATPase